MEREIDDVNHDLSVDELNELEERRISRLNEAGIDEKVVISDAEEQMNSWNSYFNENITRGKDDLNFTIRDQWTAIERSEFSRLFKPSMTFNKLYDPIKKIVGEQRKNKPDLLVRSLNGIAKQDQINLRADLVRTISYDSQNDLVYQTAFKSALMMGFGAFQVGLDYESPRSFNKKIKYELVPDPTLCAWDPTALKPHKGDGNFCSRRFVYSRDEFFATYPYVTNPVSFIDSYLLLDFQWETKDTIIVCDHFVKHWFPLIIYKLSNGMVVDQEQWEEAKKVYNKQKELTEGSIVSKIIEKGMPTIVGERQTQDYIIRHYRMLRNQIIDFSEWPSRQLPIMFVDGDSYFVEGRQYTKSFIREARDSQKLLNYSRSETAAELKNRRREQWLVTADNILGNEQAWKNPEVQLGALVAKPDAKTGMMPQKMPAWDISQGLFVTASSATQDLREILGFSEIEELQGKDISGKARRERKLEGSMSAYVYFDNLNQAIEQSGKIVNDLLDYTIGQEERNFVLTKKDGKSQSIIINQKQSDGTVKNQLEPGEFDVEIDTGPSFSVQKDTALEFFQQTIAANPQTFPLIADLWAKNLDVQFMPQISDRFKTMVPPEILAKEEGKEPPPPKPDPQQQMMQMQMQMKQQELQLKQQGMQERSQKLQMEQRQHELEQARLQIDIQKMMQDVVNDHSTNEVQKARLLVELKKIEADSLKAHEERAIKHHKNLLDHHADMSNIHADLHKHHNPINSS